MCPPSRTGSGTRCPIPTDMGVLGSIPFSTCSWLPWGSHHSCSQGQLRGTGCSQPVLNPGKRMELGAGWCWAGISLGTHEDRAGVARGDQGHPAPHGWAASTPDGPSDQHCEQGQRGHPCHSRMGLARAMLCFIPRCCSWCCGHSLCSDPSSCGTVSCPHLCQPRQAPKPLEGIVGGIW